MIAYLFFYFFRILYLQRGAGWYIIRNVAERKELAQKGI